MNHFNEAPADHSSTIKNDRLGGANAATKFIENNGLEKIAVALETAIKKYGKYGGVTVFRGTVGKGTTTGELSDFDLGFLSVMEPAIESRDRLTLTKIKIKSDDFDGPGFVVHTVECPRWKLKNCLNRTDLTKPNTSEPTERSL